MTVHSPLQLVPARLPCTDSSRWLEVVSHTNPKYGGLSSAVPALTRELMRNSCFDISIAAFTAPKEEVTPDGIDDGHIGFWPVSRKPWMQDQTLRDDFEKKVVGFSGIHIHGLWEQSTSIAAQTARARKVPYIISAHGMLEPWALAHKRLKKLLYAHLVERKNVAQAFCLHALTHAEAQQYIHFGGRCPIAIIPNAVCVPAQSSSNLFLSRFPQLQGKRLVLFLSRLNKKKGLDLLLEAWALCASHWPDAQLVLAGPDTEGTRTKLEQTITRRGLRSSVLFVGMLGYEMKWSALAAAECFVLPSRSEGMSISVLEAMGAGTPVIITKACNMSEVEKAGAGWQIEANVQELTSALAGVLQNSQEENVEIGARGAVLIKLHHNWPVVARQMADLYHWVQQTRDRRDSVPANLNMVYP